MHHAILEKHTLLHEIQQLLEKSRQAGGLSASAFLDLQLLVRDIVIHGIRTRASVSYKASSWLSHGRHSIWGLALSFLKIRPEDLATFPPSSTLVVVSNEDEDLKEDFLAALRTNLTIWLGHHMRQRGLSKEIHALTANAERIGRYYMECAVFAVPDDLRQFLDDLAYFEALPFLPSSLTVGFARDMPLAAACTSSDDCDAQGHVFAKNNVQLSSGITLASATAGVRGYLSLVVPDAGEPSISADTTLRLLWTRNDHFRMDEDSVGCGEEGGARADPNALPPHWDEAYDPATGRHYYLNHEEKITTWQDPRKRRASSAALGEHDTASPMYSSPLLLPSCKCSREQKLHVGKLQLCTLVIDFPIKAPVHVEVLSDARDCGRLIIHPDILNTAAPPRITRPDAPSTSSSSAATTHGDNPAFEGISLTAPIIFTFENGGLGAVKAALLACKGCILHSPSPFNGAGDASTDQHHAHGDGSGSGSSSSFTALKMLRFARRSTIIIEDDEHDIAEKWEVQACNEADASRSVTLTTFQTFMNPQGVVQDWDALKKLVFFRGIHPAARVEIWKYYFGLFPWESTSEERNAIIKAKRAEYWEMKLKWLKTPDAQAETLRKVLKDMIKDVVRTDRDFVFYAGEGNPRLTSLLEVLVTYAYYDAGLPYTQGMSDVLSPLLAVMKDEAVAFWCFVGIMERQGSNFDEEGSGMHTVLDEIRSVVQVLCPDFYDYCVRHDALNMFFSYRWLLLDFKREFPMTDVMKMWDIIWSRHRTDRFSTFLAAAIVDLYGGPVVRGNMSPDDMLEYYNGLSMNMHAPRVIQRARALLYECRNAQPPAELAPMWHTLTHPSSMDISATSLSPSGVSSPATSRVPSGTEIKHEDDYPAPF